MPREGEAAPDLTLLDTDFNRVTLSEQLGEGPVVLAFYPAAFTSVCTEEMCSFRDSMASFNALGAKIFGISVDTPFTNAVFKKQNGLNFPVLSDFNKEVIGKCDVVLEDPKGLKGLAKRSVFIIDEDGTIRYRWVGDDPGVSPDIPEIAEQVKRLR